jgi:hypothetical protein
LLKYDPELFNVIGECSLGNCYIAISLDYFDGATYADQIRPHGFGLGDAVSNVERLCQSVAKGPGRFSISVRTLLTQHTTEHSFSEQIDWIAGLFETYGDLVNVEWRLAEPWEPIRPGVKTTPGRSKSAEVREKINGMIEAAKDRLAGTGVLRVREYSMSSDCQHCLTQFLYAAIAYDGTLAACQGTASPSYPRLSYGNLATDDFFERWYGRTREQLSFRPGIDCPACAAPHEALVNSLTTKN